jgi:hypothetical protein
MGPTICVVIGPTSDSAESCSLKTTAPRNPRILPSNLTDKFVMIGEYTL